MGWYIIVISNAMHLHLKQCCPTFLIPRATKKNFFKPRAAPEKSDALNVLILMKIMNFEQKYYSNPQM